MQQPLPSLPAILVDPKLPVWVCSTLWLAGSVVLGMMHVFGDRPLDVWFWTATAGWLLGLIGFATMSWQRSASRRGSRSAQSGLS